MPTFSDLYFATDENYPTGSDAWSNTPTKVQPSSGALAQGITPGDQYPAQYVNYLLNSVIKAGQSASLQDAYEGSEAQGVTTPHINLSSGLSASNAFLKIGTDANPENIVHQFLSGTDQLSVTYNSTSLQINNRFLAISSSNSSSLALRVATGYTTFNFLDGISFNDNADTPDFSKKTFRGGSDYISDPFIKAYDLDAGAWYPTIIAMNGTGVTTGSLTGLSGSYTRIGNTIDFNFRITSVNTSAWSGTVYIDFELPVTGTILNNIHGGVSLASPSPASPAQTYFTRAQILESTTTSGLLRLFTVKGDDDYPSLPVDVFGKYIII